MTNEIQTTQTRYAQLDPAEKKIVDRVVQEIFYAGQEAFWQDTGLQAGERRNYWAVVKYAMGEAVSPGASLRTRLKRRGKAL
jgi:hypothetical protein